MIEVTPLGRDVNAVVGLSSVRELIPRDYFTIDFRLTSLCNYRCEYCVDLINNNVKGCYGFVKEDLLKVINTIKSFNKPVHLFLFGGEPTIHKDFYWVVDLFREHLTNEKDVIEIQTNMWMHIDRLHALISRWRGSRVQFCVSYHPTQTDFISVFNKALLLHKWDMLRSFKVMHVTRFHDAVIKSYNQSKLIFKDVAELSMLHCGQLEETEDGAFDELQDYERCKEYSSGVNDYWGENILLNDQYCTSQFELFYKQANCFYGMSCGIPSYKISIDPFGYVYKCPNEMFSTAHIERWLHVSEERTQEFILDTSPYVCPFRRCYFDNMFAPKDGSIDFNFNPVPVSNQDVYISTKR